MLKYRAEIIEYLGNPIKMIIERDKIKKPWYDISSNPNIDLKYIEDHPEFPWDFRGLSSNPNLTYDFIKKYSYKGWDWPLISYFINLQELDEQGLNNINWQFASDNPTITIELILKYWDSLDWFLLSRNKFITVEILEKYPDWPWNATTLSANPNITINYIRNNNKRWSWERLSHNPGITMQQIEDNPDLPWNWKYIVYNNNINLEFIKKYRNKIPNLFNVSANEGIKAKDIIENINEGENIPFDFTIFENPNMTMNDILYFHKDEWCNFYSHTHGNPNIDYNFIKEHFFHYFIDSFRNKFLHNNIAYYNRLRAEIKKRRRCPWVRRDPYRFIVKSMNGIF